MIVTLYIADRSSFSGHGTEDMVVDMVDTLLPRWAEELTDLDPDQHVYEIKREK